MAPLLTEPHALTCGVHGPERGEYGQPAVLSNWRFSLPGRKSSGALAIVQHQILFLVPIPCWFCYRTTRVSDELQTEEEGAKRTPSMFIRLQEVFTAGS